MDAYATILAGARRADGARRRERPGADPRQPADGALEQPRLRSCSRTGNKTEMAVGYATLYGDMAGGFAVIKDVPKPLVYELVRYRNERAGQELVPASVIERAPSAELRPDQRDKDSLPPYELLDRDPRGLRRARPLARGAGRRGLARRGRRPGHRAGRPRRVQAPPGAARHQDHVQGVRPRPPAADHEPLRGLAGSVGGSAGIGDASSDERAEAALVVGELDVPDPSRAAAVAGAATALTCPSRSGAGTCVCSTARARHAFVRDRRRRWPASRATRRARRRRRRGRSRRAA